ncbi:MAG: nucleoside deaminase [Clostridia bacterium]|nr:nucleoside deaminase [Clostridia bacterium]
MILAAKRAKKTMNENKGGPFGAAITDAEGNLISVASNLVLQKHDPTAHAEIMAIRAACRKLGTHDLSGHILYATGYPCPMCLSAMIWANIKVCYYAADPKEAEKIGFRDDFIYKFIQKGCRDRKIMTFTQKGHDEAAGLYAEYALKEKEIY